MYTHFIDNGAEFPSLISQESLLCGDSALWYPFGQMYKDFIVFDLLDLIDFIDNDADGVDPIPQLGLVAELHVLGRR